MAREKMGGSQRRGKIGMADGRVRVVKWDEGWRLGSGCEVCVRVAGSAGGEGSYPARSRSESVESSRSKCIDEGSGIVE